MDLISAMKKFGRLNCTAGEKIKVAGKNEGYFEILFPDVLREYLFRRTLNAISLLSMMEVEDVQCMFTESVR